MDAEKREALHRFDQYYTTDDLADCQQLYTKFAHYYDTDSYTLLGPTQDDAVEVAMEYFTNNENSLLLEAAAGTGLCGLSMRKLGYKGTMDALDTNTDLLKIAETRSIYRNIIRFELSPYTNLPMEEKTYDDLLCFGAFLPQHIEPECIEPMLRVIKPGGVFVFTTHLTPEQQSYEVQLEKFLSHLTASGQAETMLRVVKPGGTFASTSHLTPEHQYYEGPLEKVLASLSASGQTKVVVGEELNQ